MLYVTVPLATESNLPIQSTVHMRDLASPYKTVPDDPCKPAQVQNDRRMVHWHSQFVQEEGSNLTESSPLDENSPVMEESSITENCTLGAELDLDMNFTVSLGSAVEEGTMEHIAQFEKEYGIQVSTQNVIWTTISKQ